MSTGNKPPQNMRAITAFAVVLAVLIALGFVWLLLESAEHTDPSAHHTMVACQSADKAARKG